MVKAIVRAHRWFYKIVVVNSTADKEADAKKKAFTRCLKDAADDGLIVVREVNGETLVWQLAPKDNTDAADVAIG